MIKKILIPVFKDEVAPRFDLALEAHIITFTRDKKMEEQRSVILSQASSEKLCQLTLTENIHTVICGAIEEEFYQFLRWKKIKVIDSVAGPVKDVLRHYIHHTLEPGQMLWPRTIEGHHV